MKRLTRLIHEAHRRSLWQVLGIYIVASWGVIEFVDGLASLLDLPAWAPRLALFLLIIGLPIVLATAFVQEGVRVPVEKPDALPAADQRTTSARPSPVNRLFTWRNALLGGGLAFALLGAGAAGWVALTHARSGKEQIKRIAVLPFENEGTAEDEYFADGVSDEVRTKLAGIPGLQVTARGSTNQYKKTSKAPKEIGRELEVQYLLTGTVRWAKASAGNRVRVNPELINVSDASTIWTDAIERELSDVFSVQTDIAGKVANQLNLTLGTRTQQRLADRPTSNIEAWDAYLHGEEITQNLGVVDVVTFRKALPFYTRATELDSTFAEAWSRIARVETELTRLNPTPEGVERVKRAAERSLASAPQRAAGRLATAVYLRTLQKDYAGAVEQARAGLVREPNNSELLDVLASSENSLGKFDSALVHLQHARDLNPRSVTTRRLLALTNLYSHRPREALQSTREALELSPLNIPIIQMYSQIWASLGDLDSARAVVRAALARGVDTTTLIARYALIQEQMWLLPPELLPKITRLTPKSFDGDRSQWGLKVGGTWKLLGDVARGRSYADSALSLVEAQLRNFPDNAELHEMHGRALALAGRKEEAVQEAELSLRMRETTLDATTGPYVKFQVVRILIQSGQLDRAMDELEQLIDVPGFTFTRAYLRLDPSFQPLKGNPRFERLTAPTI